MPSPPQAKKIQNLTLLNTFFAYFETKFLYSFFLQFVFSRSLHSEIVWRWNLSMFLEIKLVFCGVIFLWYYSATFLCTGTGKKLLFWWLNFQSNKISFSSVSSSFWSYALRFCRVVGLTQIFNYFWSFSYYKLSQYPLLSTENTTKIIKI